MSLDSAWEEAVNLLESLPDERTPSIYLGFSRLDDNRRKAVLKNGHSLFFYSADISLKFLPHDKRDRNIETSDWKTIKGFGEKPEIAVSEAVKGLREFLS